MKMAQAHQLIKDSVNFQGYESVSSMWGPLRVKVTCQRSVLLPILLRLLEEGVVLVELGRVLIHYLLRNL